MPGSRLAVLVVRAGRRVVGAVLARRRIVRAVGSRLGVVAGVDAAVGMIRGVVIVLVVAVVVVDRDRVVAPVVAPVAPVRGGGAGREAGTEGQQAVAGIGVVGRRRRREDRHRVVLRHVDQLRVRRLDDDRAGVA